jgi:hypothetical protein
VDSRPSIPESFVELRQFFASPWVERWTIPNPFVAALASPLQAAGVELSDFSFNNSAANLGEDFLNVSLRRLHAGVRIGLDNATFLASNPDWGAAPHLVAVFEQISQQIRKVVEASPQSQQATLAFHVTPGTADFGQVTASLVNRSVVGEWLFSGVSLHRAEEALVIDKSLRYDGAAFVRVQRRFAGDTLFGEIAAWLYDAEVAALRLLGLREVP